MKKELKHIKELKYIFETEKDFKILQAVKKYIGKKSISNIVDDGLTREEAELCEDFYDLMEGEL